MSDVILDTRWASEWLRGYLSTARVFATSAWADGELVEMADRDHRVSLPLRAGQGMNGLRGYVSILTARRREKLALALRAKGLTYKAIGRRLGVGGIRAQQICARGRREEARRRSLQHGREMTQASSTAERWIHAPETIGSTPTPATNRNEVR